ncbi:MAG TPA: hypothetical protein VG755_16705 [Nannocystaceae bacterium]|nr:hypothetical protein [Nannocystaceae bacterium]
MNARHVVLVSWLLGCGSQASADAESSSSSSAADESSTGAPPRCGGAPGNCATYSPCEMCGDPMSVFDDQGCIRPACTRDMDCGEQRCFIPTVFDICSSSLGECTDDPVTMTCNCDFANDCTRGGWCVPSDSYPPLAAGPAGVLIVAQTCGPDDGVLVSLRSYPIGTTVDCAAPPDGVDPQLELVFAEPALLDTYRFSAMASNGSGTFDDDGDDVMVRAATLTVADISAPTTDGSYTYILYEGSSPSLYGGAFTSVLSCPVPAPCG